jgi:hypothetical protein
MFGHALHYVLNFLCWNIVLDLGKYSVLKQLANLPANFVAILAQKIDAFCRKTDKHFILQFINYDSHSTNQL